MNVLQSDRYISAARELAAAAGLVAFGMLSINVVGCTKETASTVTLDCSTDSEPKIRHILRIDPASRTAQDLSFNPAKPGTAEVNDAGYVLRFSLPGEYELRFKVNRFTADGTREVTNPTVRTGQGHGVFDTISCKPYSGKPL